MPKKIPAEALIGLHQRLAGLPARSSERRRVLREAAELYGICEQSRIAHWLNVCVPKLCGALIVVFHECCLWKNWNTTAKSSLL